MCDVPCHTPAWLPVTHGRSELGCAVHEQPIMDRGYRIRQGKRGRMHRGLTIVHAELSRCSIVMCVVVTESGPPPAASRCMQGTEEPRLGA